MLQQEYVILVDENDQSIGIEEKLAAHQQAKLHRAFSIFIVRKKNNEWEFLLQQRQHTKYHSAGLWTNTCCSHPAPAETIAMAAKRRLLEEMGIKTSLREIGSFIYRAPVGAGLIEHEFDHVLLGVIDNAQIKINPMEVADYQWLDSDKLKKDLLDNPQKYTAWFPQALNFVLLHLDTLP